MRDRLLALAVTLPLLSGVGPAGAAAPGSLLTSNMIDAYRQSGAYRATWIMTSVGDDSERHEIEVAFDPPTDMLLVRRQVQRRIGDRWIALPEGELLVSDGRTIRAAVRSDERASWEHLEVSPEDSITYWVIQRCLTVEPIDLPLLLGEHPLMGWLRDVGGAVDSLDAEALDAPARPELRITGAASHASVRATLDPHTHFIQNAMNDRVDRRFTLESLTIDEPLSDRLFDFERQLDAFDPPISL